MKLFLSHASADLHWAEWIGVLLQGAGHEVFLRHWEVGAGESIPAWIERRIAEADKVIAVFTPAYLAAQGPRGDAAPPGRDGGTQTRTEGAERLAAVWRDLSGRDGFLVPIAVDRVDTWPTLSAGRHALSLVGLDEEAAESALIDFLKPPTRPTGKVAFPGKAKTGGGEETVTVTVETTAPAKPNDEAPTAPPVALPRRSTRPLTSPTPPEPAPRPKPPRRDAGSIAPDDARPIIRSRKDLVKWLAGEPHAFATVIAVRAALRVAPLLVRIWSRETGDLTPSILLLPMLRSMAAPWVAHTYPAHYAGIARSIFGAASAAATSVGAAYADVSYAAAYAAEYPASDAFAVEAAASAYAVAANADGAARDDYTAGAAYAAFWDVVTVDVQALHDRADPTDVVTAPLWADGIPDQIAHAMVDLSDILLVRRDEHWHHWLEWLNDRFSDDPTRTAGDQEKDLARLTLPEEMWQAATKSVEGVKAVNAEIARRLKAIDDRRAREAAELRDEEEPEATAAGHAESPSLEQSKVPATSGPEKPVHPLPAQAHAPKAAVVAGRLVRAADRVVSADRLRRIERVRGDILRTASGFTETVGSNASPKLLATIAALHEFLSLSPILLLKEDCEIALFGIDGYVESYSHPQAQWELSVDGMAELKTLHKQAHKLEALLPADPEGVPKEPTPPAGPPTGGGSAPAGKTPSPSGELPPQDTKAQVDAFVDAIEDLPVVDDSARRTFEGQKQVSDNLFSEAHRAEVEEVRAATVENAVIGIAEELKKELEAPVGAKEPATSTAAESVLDDPTVSEAIEKARNTLLADGADRIAQAIVKSLEKAVGESAVTATILGVIILAWSKAKPLLARRPRLAVALEWIRYALAKIGGSRKDDGAP